MIKVLASPGFSNTTNPYNDLLYRAIVEQGGQVEEFSYRQVLKSRHFIWHLHWPELTFNHPNPFKAIVKLQLFLLAIALVKARNGKIVWTGHNLKAHENRYPRIERWFWEFFTDRLDGFISLSHAGLDAACKRFPTLHAIPNYVIPHGHYRSAYPKTISCQAAKAALGIPQETTVLLFFGRIRAYKNVPALITVFQQIPQEHRLLYIAGYSDSDELTQQIQLETHTNIRTHLKFVSSEETQLFFQAADLVVLPYREILNSGTAVLALSFDRPILLPQGGALGELQAAVGTDWVRLYQGELTAEELTQAIDWAIQMPRSDRVNLAALDWSVLAQQTIEAYQQILND